jgi:hypothetical protein
VNFVPTEATVRDKLKRRGKLFASDEVEVLIRVIDVLRLERQQAGLANREGVRAPVDRMRRPKCAKKGCRRIARYARDVHDARHSNVFVTCGHPVLHYEVCEAHCDEYFRSSPGDSVDWVERARAERIAAELVPS